MPAHVRRTVVAVDAETDLPLVLRTTGLRGSTDEDGPARVERETDEVRFSLFERLDERDGAAGLRPSARFASRG